MQELIRSTTSCPISRIPEALKNTKETCYKSKTNVIKFREFFDEEIAVKRPNYQKIQTTLP